MTIKETVEYEQKKEFVSVMCSRCIRYGRPLFRKRINDPTQEDIDNLQYRAFKHDRNGKHPILLIISTRSEQNLI